MTARSATSDLISHEELLTLLAYDPETGDFWWRVKPLKGRVQAGDIAGSEFKGGYWGVRIKQAKYPAHRLAWFYVHGRWPEHDIDHINGDRMDNRIANLRDVPRSVNLQNQRRAKAHNALGVLGVRKRGNRYAARIDNAHLGYFDTPEEAHAAYVAAKREMHEGCTL
jgi:hypothetical protein